MCDDLEEFLSLVGTEPDPEIEREAELAWILFGQMRPMGSVILIDLADSEWRDD